MSVQYEPNQGLKMCFFRQTSQGRATPWPIESLACWAYGQGCLQQIENKYQVFFFCLTAINILQNTEWVAAVFHLQVATIRKHRKQSQEPPTVNLFLLILYSFATKPCIYQVPMIIRDMCFPMFVTHRLRTTGIGRLRIFLTQIIV